MSENGTPSPLVVLIHFGENYVGWWSGLSLSIKPLGACSSLGSRSWGCSFCGLNFFLMGCGGV